MTHDIIYKTTGSLKIGDVHRYILTYTSQDINAEIGSSIYVKVKNIENVLMNSAVFNGPFFLYCDIRNESYDHNVPCFVSDEQPVYDPNIIPGQSLTHKLVLNKLQNKYVWIIDIISQIIFSTTSEINFEILVSRTEEGLSKGTSSLKNGNFLASNLNIQHLSTMDIWNRPPKSVTEPIHLVVLTHGLHSNTSADMFYLKERIELMATKTNENILVRGYFGNACKTERGVKYLGRRLAESVVNEMVPSVEENGTIAKISFISHSLGGLVQTFAISYISFNYPQFFEKIKPETFIAMASPLLGISNENPSYVKMCLKFGIVGKTGQDLNLDGNQPLLLLLPSKPTRKILKQFKRRTVYANILNDGIVPLRTSALLYLDWKALTKIYEDISGNAGDIPSAANSTDDKNDSSSSGGTEADEIPENVEANQRPNHDFFSSFKSKIQSTIGYCLPNMQAPKTTHKYNYIQTTIDTDDSLDQQDDPNNPAMNTIKDVMTTIPKSSIISSIKKIILPPTPTSKYICNPKSRYNVILHDKIYTPDMIPKRHTILSKNIIISQLETSKRHRFLEEKIARRWHNGMSWRKVLVYLQPDAHNNIVVRRRFANAYGWQVIDHLVDEHFGFKSVSGDDLSLWEIKEKEVLRKSDTIDLDLSEMDHINDQFGKVMTKEFDKETKEKNNGTNKGNPLLKLPILKELKKAKSETSGEDSASASDNNEEDEEDENVAYQEEFQDEDNESCASSDNELNQINGDWFNETASGYYDGPTGFINCVHEGVAAWTKSVTGTSPSHEGITNTNDDDTLALEDGLKELNEVGELNAYV